MTIDKIKTPEERWQERIYQWETSQMTAKAWCLENGVCYESFINWRKRFRNTQEISNTPTAAFIELFDNSSVASGIEIHFRRLRLILTKDFDSCSLLRCLQVLEKTSC